MDPSPQPPSCHISQNARFKGPQLAPALTAMKYDTGSPVKMSPKVQHTILKIKFTALFFRVDEWRSN